ncbi:MAG: carbon-nitrogen hydrolase family protein [Euryarchaeota archaeon]|nr:carbon-nitrogen hydrolase family protein [Euryarchaeota archaeon]
MKRILKVVLAQYEAKLGDKEWNSERILEVTSKVRSDIYAFPELYLTGYLIKDRVLYLAEDLKNPSRELKNLIENLRELNSLVIFGFPEKDLRGIYYNSAMILGKGLIKVYRKSHLPNFGPFREMLYYSPGEPYQPIIEVNNDLRIGIEICYDIFFPEIAKYYALQGADLLITISASPITSRALFEKLIPARAIENVLYHAYVNYPGVSEDLLFWGGSRVVDPRGNIISKAKYFEEDLVIAEIDLEKLNVMRLLRPTYRDTIISH